MTQSEIVLTTLVGYKVLLVTIGLWAQRRTRDNADFFLGGRSLGPVVAAISYAASSSSAWTLLGVSGSAFALGLGTIWLLPGILTCHIIAWFWIAPRLRERSLQQDHLTRTDLLAEGSSNRLRAAIVSTASIIILFCFLFYVASQFQGAGNTFTSNFDISASQAIVVGGMIVLIYTLLGGFWAVSVTDTLQGLLMLAASVLLPIMALISVGGFEALLDGLQQQATTTQLSLTGGNFGLLGLGFVAGMMLVGLGTFGQPHLLNRFMALRDERALRQARIISIGWFAAVLVGMVILGLCGRILLPTAGNGEALFFELTNSLLPTVVAAVMTAAVLSAIMSTADSQLLVAASCVAHDLGLSRRWPQHTLAISRAVMALICALSIAVAILLPESIFSRVLFAWNGLGAAFGPVVFATLAGWRVAPAAKLASMLIGFGLTGLLYWLPNTPGDVAERVVPFVLATVVVLIGRQRH